MWETTASKRKVQAGIRSRPFFTFLLTAVLTAANRCTTTDFFSSINPGVVLNIYMVSTLLSHISQWKCKWSIHSPRFLQFTELETSWKFPDGRRGFVARRCRRKSLTEMGSRARPPHRAQKDVIRDESLLGFHNSREEEWPLILRQPIIWILPLNRKKPRAGLQIRRKSVISRQ